MTVPAPYGDTAHLLAERVAGCNVPPITTGRLADARAWLDSLPAPTPGSHESDLPHVIRHIEVLSPGLDFGETRREYHNAAAWSRANRKETAAQ